MKRIGVVGAGAMGSGIAQVAAMAGCEVLLYDAFPESIVKARDSISTSLNKLSAKGKISDTEAKAVFGRLFFIDDLTTLHDSEMIIEAIVEEEGVKKELFKKLESIIAPHVVIATNTSSLSVTALAAGLKHPERFIGLHYFNPPVLMALVEVIPAVQTNPELSARMREMIQTWGKEPVFARDTPGFIVNRIARPFYSEALRIAEERLAQPAVIDRAMKEVGGFRMGPFELMDFIGHDVNEAVTRSVWTATHFESRYKPSILQGNLVKAGWLGRKSGKGFYDYQQPMPEANATGDELEIIFNRILTMLIHEAADALYFGIASRDDIDKAMTKGVNYPKGLLKWADEIGIDHCVERMDALFDLYHEDRYRGSALLRRMAAGKQNFYT